MNSNFHGGFRGPGVLPNDRGPATKATPPPVRAYRCLLCLPVSEEKAWLKEFLAHRKHAQPARIEALMRPLAAREIERALDFMRAELFSTGRDDEEDRLEAALIWALSVKGLGAFEVLEAPSPKPEYFQANKVLRMDPGFV